MMKTINKTKLKMGQCVEMKKKLSASLNQTQTLRGWDKEYKEI
jgi:hypothetical protein